jgi:SAM-dependent methyltransferase
LHYENYREFYEQNASKILHQPFSPRAQEKVYWWKKIKDLTFHFLDDLNATSLLDVGCAEGYYVSCSTKQNKIKLAVGLDISYIYCHKASMISSKLGVQNKTLFIVTDASICIPFRSNTFDIVLCFETLEHIPNYYKVIEELHRVSQKWLLLSVPLEKTYLPYRLRFRKRNPSHINAFSLKDIIKALEQVGFIINEVKIVEFLPISNMFISGVISPHSLMAKIILAIESLLEKVLPPSLARDVWIVAIKRKNEGRICSIKNMDDLIDRIICTYDGTKLKSNGNNFICPSCGREFILTGNIMSEKSFTRTKINLQDFAFIHCSELK